MLSLVSRLRLHHLFVPLVCTAAWIILILPMGCSSDSPGDTEEKLSPIDLQRQSAPRSARKLVFEANRAYEQMNYSRALALLDSSQAQAAELSDIHFLRGRILTDLRQYDRAQRAYRRVLDLASDYPGIWFNMGNNAFRQGQSREAVEYYRESLRHSPKSSAYINMGRAYEQLSRADSAQWTYRQVLEMNNPSKQKRAEAHGRLSELYDTEGSVEKALEHARRAVELDPGNQNYRYLLGARLFRLGRYGEAVEYLHQVTENRPAHYSSHYKLGQALARTGQAEASREYLARADSLQTLESTIDNRRRATHQNPSNVMAWVRYGDALRQARRYSDALQAYQAALNLSPGNLPLMDNIANLHMMVGDTSRAIRQYREIVSVDSTMARTWLNLGVAYAQTNQFEKARHAWLTALEQRPDYTLAKKYLEQISSRR